MQHKIIHLHQTASTNDYLRALPSPQDDSMTVVYADWQTAGRGQGSNKWESEAGKNLLFSILVCPTSIDITRQFVLSMAEALALKEAIDSVISQGCDGEDVRLKWPNDIYWRDNKISGTLIETTLSGKTIKTCIFGTGIDVNQTVFRSEAPNPLSLCSIVGTQIDREALLESIVTCFERYYKMVVDHNYDRIADAYKAALYRRTGMHRYADRNGEFCAEIKDVALNGTLTLQTDTGETRHYAFKEVKFIIYPDGRRATL